MKIYFEDGPLVKFKQLPVKPDFAISAGGVSTNMAMLDYLVDTSPHSVIYTNEIVALHSKYAWNPDLQMPEIYIRAGEHGVFTPITELTTRELKEGHDYAKMYIAGEFNHNRANITSNVEMENKIAKLTGTAIQDNESFKVEGGFEPERDQYYFEMRQGNHVFLVGFKDLLLCLRLLEKIEEVPEINNKWWLQMASLYGNDILMVDFE